MMIITSLRNVAATTESIQLGVGSQTKSYVAGTSIHYTISRDGKYYLYTLNNQEAKNILVNKVKNSTNVDGGITYILKNGYPNKSFTGDMDKDYYITQTALWWYLDMTIGSTNLSQEFKSTGADTYGLRQTIKQLAYDGYSHRKDSITTTEQKFILGVVGSSTMTLKDDYYISNDIKATTIKNMNNYSVTLANAPSGTRIVSSSGVETVYSKEFTIQGTDSFKVKVPLASLTGTELSIKVNATAVGNEQYTVNEYEPIATTAQNTPNVVSLVKGSSRITSEVSLDIISSKVTIVAVDSNSKQPLAGAKLALKNEEGKLISSWTSTINGHILRNLPNGTYTIEEQEAPNGYLRNTTAVKFTINDKNREMRVTIENTAKEVVVNIIKLDQASNTPLSGAVLVVKRADGTEIDRFTTDGTPHILTDLADGTYTVEEISAPSGYIKSNEKISFTVDKDHLSHQITLINARAVEVPDTMSTSSIFIIILGIAITGIGIKYIYKNGKRI